MTPVDTVILDLVAVLIGRRRDRGLMNRIVNGEQHTPGCPKGQFLRPTDRLTNGSPCSDRCLEAWAAILQARDWLYANRDAAAAPASTPAQLPLVVAP